jgi:prepilin-type N-terminal cleavage/methylation domain-containing protein
MNYSANYLIVRRASSVRPGFTLVELLVVITILVVLASLVAVMSGRIRGRAAEANAINGLRQVALANLSYSIENHGNINTLRWVGDPEEGGPNAWVSNSFWGRLQPFLFSDLPTNNQQSLRVQMRERVGQFFNTTDASTMAGTVIDGARIYHDGAGMPIPLAFNGRLHKWAEFQKTASFGDPARVLYVTYGFGFFNEAHAQRYVPRPRDNSRPEGVSIYYMDDRKALMVFLDGHVEAMTPPIPRRLFQ